MNAALDLFHRHEQEVGDLSAGRETEAGPARTEPWGPNLL